MDDWPLKDISKPHSTNDVLWHHKKKLVVDLFIAGVLDSARDCQTVLAIDDS